MKETNQRAVKCFEVWFVKYFSENIIDSPVTQACCVIVQSWGKKKKELKENLMKVSRRAAFVDRQSIMDGLGPEFLWDGEAVYDHEIEEHKARLGGISSDKRGGVTKKT